MKKYIIKFWYGFGNWCGPGEPHTEEEAAAKIAAIAMGGAIIRHDPDGSMVAIPWHRVTRVTLTPAP